MSEIVYLDLEDLLASAEAFLGHQPEVRDWGLLESAVARPQATVFGQDAYPTVHLKAAALLASLVGNHALIDGNKRLGFVGTLLFYGYNGWRVVATDDEKFDLVMAVADGSLVDVADIAERLTPLMQPR